MAETPFWPKNPEKNGFSPLLVKIPICWQKYAQKKTFLHKYPFLAKLSNQFLFFLTMTIQIGKAPLRPKIVKFQMFICSMCVPFNKYRRRSHHHI